MQEVNKDKFEVVATIPTQKGARTIAANSTTHHLYLPAAEYKSAESGKRPAIIPGSFVILDVLTK